MWQDQRPQWTEGASGMKTKIICWSVPGWKECAVAGAEREGGGGGERGIQWGREGGQQVRFLWAIASIWLLLLNGTGTIAEFWAEEWWQGLLTLIFRDYSGFRFFWLSWLRMEFRVFVLFYDPFVSSNSVDFKKALFWSNYQMIEVARVVQRGPSCVPSMQFPPWWCLR